MCIDWMFIGLDFAAVFTISDLSGTRFPTRRCGKRQHFNLHQLTPPISLHCMETKVSYQKAAQSHLLVGLRLFSKPEPVTANLKRRFLALATTGSPLSRQRAEPCRRAGYEVHRVTVDASAPNVSRFASRLRNAKQSDAEYT